LKNIPEQLALYKEVYGEVVIKEGE